MYLSSSHVGIAVELDKLARRMDQPAAFKSAVKSRLNFLVRAVQLRVVDQLNNVGDLLPGSLLSERSLDRVFEYGDVSAEVVAQAVARADQEPEFNDALIHFFGPASIAAWREQSQRQGVLL